MTTTSHPSTSLELPNTIAKYALMSMSETLADGTVTYTYKGFVSSTDAHLFYLAAMTNDGVERHTKHHVVFSAKGDNFDWSVKQNYVPRGKKFYVTFVMNDYTVPAQAEANEPIKAPQTYAQFNPTIYEKKIRNFQERYDIANEWLIHMVSVDVQCGWDNSMGVNSAIVHLNHIADLMVDFIEAMNQIIE